MTDRNAPKLPASLPITIGDWIVTENGLESRVLMRDGRTIYYVIDSDRLLKVHDLGNGVADLAMQVAGKSWVPTPAANAAFIDALAVAIERHYPGQDTIDVTATRAAAEREWRRTHRRPFGRQFLFDVEEVIRARADFEHEEALATTPLPDAVDPSWLVQYPAEHRALVRQHGVDPGVHPDADACKLRITADTGPGVAGDALAYRADEHQRAYVAEEEPPEEDDGPEEDLLYELSKDRT